MQSDTETVQFGKIGRFPSGVSRRDTGHERRIQTTTEQDTPGNIGHHTSYDSLFKGNAECFGIIRRRRQRPWLRNVIGFIPTNKFIGILPLVAKHMSGWELLQTDTFIRHGLHFTTDPNAPIVSPTNVEGSNANVIPYGQEIILLLVVQNKRKHPTQLIRHLGGIIAVLQKQRNDGLTITSRHGFVRSVQRGIDFFIIVDFTIGG
mmetsp:Transcript_3146/g.4789  ORF Transcript_3146/g.4789 Transcript_3146/m.4789 type:complete len:205 (+) Transcript_3146:819-1433(+)